MATTASDIQRYILQCITDGKLKSGDRLPSRPELERRFQCARATVDRALTELRRNRVIRTEVGKGTFVAPARGKAKASRLRVIVIPALARQSSRDLFVFGIYRELARCLSRRDGIVQATIEEPRADRGPDRETLRKASMVYWVRSSPAAEPLMMDLAREGIAQLLLNRDFGSIPCVATDAAAGQRDAVAYLASLGHRRIGYAHPPVNPLRGFESERMIGYLDGINRAGIAAGDAPRIEVPGDRGPEVERVLSARLAAADAPTALIIQSYLVGPLIRALAGGRPRIPQDLSVLTIDEVQDPHGLYGTRFTCQRQRLAEMGRRAAEMDPGDLWVNGAASRTRMSPALVVGDTTTAPPARRGHPASGKGGA